VAAVHHEIERVFEGYRTRLTIEDCFKAVKTGCAYAGNPKPGRRF